MNAISEYGTKPQAPSGRGDTVIGSLVWLQWRYHRCGVIYGGLAVALALFVSTLEKGAQEEMISLMLISIAWGTGLGFGRLDWQEGQEEFQLTLPATRAQRYWVKFGYGVGMMALCYLIALVVCYTPAFDFVRAWLPELKGAPEDLPLGPGAAFVVLALFVPPLLFVESFTAAMGISRRGSVAWLPRFLALLVVGEGLFLAGERWIPESFLWILGPVFLGCAALRVRSGLRQYEAKDAVLEASSSGVREKQVLIGVAILLLGVLAATLTLWLVMHQRGQG